MQLEGEGVGVGVDKFSYTEEMRKRDCEAFEIRMSILKNTLKSLSNLDVKIIGVFGMGGVGKTYNTL